jgi:hypothetical protein
LLNCGGYWTSEASGILTSFGAYTISILTSFRSINQLIGDVQEMFSCVDSDSVLKTSCPHSHLDSIEMTDSFMELIEEVPIYICKVNDNAVDG